MKFNEISHCTIAAEKTDRPRIIAEGKWEDPNPGSTFWV